MVTKDFKKLHTT